jgi:hypothetical protein
MERFMAEVSFRKEIESLRLGAAIPSTARASWP